MSSSAIRSAGRIGPSSSVDGAAGAISKVADMRNLPPSDTTGRHEMWGNDAIRDRPSRRDG
jgi:hypothetical protein